jgi:hypothetical protein
MHTTHTPGPWSAKFAIWTGGPTIDEPGCFQIEDSQQNVLCTRHPWAERAVEMRANAHLIAAAPDMLAALEDAALVINAMSSGTLPHCFEPTLEMVNAINYAIAKAKGLASEDRHA